MGYLALGRVSCLLVMAGMCGRESLGERPLPQRSTTYIRLKLDLLPV